MLQAAIGVERQLPPNTAAAVTYTNSRALHLDQTVPINPPPPGTYIPGQPNSGVRPYGLTAGNLFEYEFGGMLHQNILMANFNTRFCRYVSLFGIYHVNHSNDPPSTSSHSYYISDDSFCSSLCL